MKHKFESLHEPMTQYIKRHDSMVKPSTLEALYGHEAVKHYLTEAGKAYTDKITIKSKDTMTPPQRHDVVILNGWDGTRPDWI